MHRRPIVSRAPARRAGWMALAALGAALVSASSVHAQPAPLRPLADEVGLAVGAAVDAASLEDAAHRDLLIAHVNMLSTRGELAMATVQPRPGEFDFSAADALVDFAVEHDMVVRGHELIGPEVPTWVADGTWTADTLSEVLRDHVTAVVGRYRDRNPGAVVQWDVLSEAFLPDGSPRPTIWQQVIGDDHLRIAFEAARAADPDAQLFYDDFYDDIALTQDAVATGTPITPGATAERSTCDLVPKCVAVRERLTALVAAATPIDGVGFQARSFSPSPADLASSTAWVAELGLVWAVTEFAVPLPVTEIANADSLAFQATVFADALTACLDADGCDTFVMWGLTDRFSPIPIETAGTFGGALAFDDDDDPTPAVDAMVDVLSQRATPDTTTPPVSATDRPSATPDTSSPGTMAGGDDESGAGAVLAIVAASSLVVLAGAAIVATRRRRPPPAP